MKTLEQIKNDYAISKGYEDFNSLVNWEQNNDDNIVLNSNINEVMKIYAMECLKLASENVICNENYININGIEVLNEFSVKQSITNENNLIK